MLFHVVASLQSIPAASMRQVFLVPQAWNDWYKFQTGYLMYVRDDTGILHEPGSVKIGRKGLQPGPEVKENVRRPTLDDEFDVLDPDHFSLGQGENFYETLNQLNLDFKDSILRGLRDCAFDLTIFNENLNEEVMSESLLRAYSTETVQRRLNRLAHGNPKLTRFNFDYTMPVGITGVEPPTLGFSVVPFSRPPTNVHVLIGRNSVGKTRCMQGLARAALGDPAKLDSTGTLRIRDEAAWTFSSVVMVAFSAFDTFHLPANIPSGTRATLVGLRANPENAADLSVKTSEQLAADFVESLSNCKRGLKAQRWLNAITSLSADPLFEEANAAAVFSGADVSLEQWSATAMRWFEELSSGHKVVLLTLTRLVDLVEEKTLVLLDEPEGHLHPPLLSAFIRALAELLINRNGVAIVATHSPVVLQEVPKSCAWVLERSGRVATADRPNVETFGENVGTLTREVFKFEVTKTGFHQLVQKAIETQQLSYDSVLDHFDDQLGMEARAIARSLVAERDSRGSE